MYMTRTRDNKLKPVKAVTGGISFPVAYGILLQYIDDPWAMIIAALVTFAAVYWVPNPKVEE